MRSRVVNESDRAKRERLPFTKLERDFHVFIQFHEERVYVEYGFDFNQLTEISTKSKHVMPFF